MFSHHTANTTKSRGVAIVIAIAVLAILTILLMALSYSAGFTQTAQHTRFTQLRAERLARAGFDLAAAALAREPGNLTHPREFELQLTEGLCHLAAKPADPKDPIYAGNYIRYRPGDLILAVTASLNQKNSPRPEQTTQMYLLNVDPAHLRRLCYATSTTDGAKPEKP